MEVLGVGGIDFVVNGIDLLLKLVEEVPMIEGINENYA